MTDLIDPLTLARVKDMPLIAKTLAQGFLHGLHTSQQRGSGVEFNQYRTYEPGDPLADVDWKLFARSDKYFVREAERESDTCVWLVLDASASMLHVSEKTEQAGGWNKLDYGKHMLATIAFLAQQQGDAVGLLGLSSNKIDFVAPSRTQKHWQKLVLQLSKIESGGVFPALSSIQNQMQNINKQGLIFVVSDFYQQNTEVMDFIRNLASPRNDIVAVQLTCNDELNFPYTGQIRFEDRESGEQLLLSAQHAKKHYLSAHQRFQSELATNMAKHQIQLLQANADEPLNQTLYEFLLARSKVG